MLNIFPVRLYLDYRKKVIIDFYIFFSYLLFNNAWNSKSRKFLCNILKKTWFKIIFFYILTTSVLV